MPAGSCRWCLIAEGKVIATGPTIMGLVRIATDRELGHWQNLTPRLAPGVVITTPRLAERITRHEHRRSPPSGVR